MGLELSSGPTFSFLPLHVFCSPSHWCFPLRVVALLFGLLLFLHYCFFLHPTILIIVVLLLSFLGYCSFCTTASFFTLLFSSSCCCSPFRPPIFLFVLIGFPFHTIVSLRLFFYFRYKVFCALCVTLLFSLCHCCWCVVYSLKILVLPFYIFSCKNWEWSGVNN
jgi:hypothetical protein